MVKSVGRSKNKRKKRRLRERTNSTPKLPAREYAQSIGAEHFVPGQLGFAVFGPGKGEAIVVRLPNGGLGVVDGCREPERRSQTGDGDPVRELLAKFAKHEGRPIEEQRLAFVCLTHPHDDHYAGLGRLMLAYGDRIERLWMPHDSIRYMKDLLAYLKSTRDKTTDLQDPGVRGLHRIIDAQDRLVDTVSNLEFCFAQDGRRVLEGTHGGHHLNVTLCSPSARDAHRANRNLINSLAIRLDPATQKIYSEPDPNIISSSLLITWGKSRVLLAGDLICEDGEFQGWTSAQRLINETVQLVNVAHHASKEAHHAELWARMQPRVAVVTPFQQAARSQPPRPRMVRMLCDSGALTIITTPPQWSEDELDEFEWDPPLDRGPTDLWLRNPAFQATPVGLHDDRHNAAAISLRPDGRISRIVLAGQARCVRPRSPAPSDSQPAPLGMSRE
jgi:hypothetical protein